VTDPSRSGSNLQEFGVCLQPSDAYEPSEQGLRIAGSDGVIALCDFATTETRHVKKIVAWTAMHANQLCLLVQAPHRPLIAFCARLYPWPRHQLPPGRFASNRLMGHDTARNQRQCYGASTLFSLPHGQVPELSNQSGHRG